MVERKTTFGGLSASQFLIGRHSIDQSVRRFVARIENEVNARKRHCRIGKITKKHEPGAVVFLDT